MIIIKSNSNYGEKNITKFFNDELLRAIKSKMDKIGFHIAKREKKLYGKEFDLWFHKKNKGFVIIESEIKGWYDWWNIEKLKEIGILNWQWGRIKPKIILFQIFSPYYSKGKSRLKRKSYCLSLGKKLSKEYNNFSYFQLDVKVDYEMFEKMLSYFQNHKHATAKQHYGNDIENIIKKLIKELNINMITFVWI